MRLPFAMLLLGLTACGPSSSPCELPPASYQFYGRRTSATVTPIPVTAQIDPSNTEGCLEAEVEGTLVLAPGTAALQVTGFADRWKCTPATLSSSQGGMCWSSGSCEFCNQLGCTSLTYTFTDHGLAEGYVVIETRSHTRPVICRSQYDATATRAGQ